MTSNISLSNVTIRLRRGSIENLPASAPAGEPLIVNNQGDYELWAGTGTGVVKISSNSGAGASFVVEQANHGFDNELVRYNSTTQLWELAYAAEVDGDSHTAIGFATSKTTDTFIVTMLGKIDLSGISYTDIEGDPLEEGEYYFLCQTSANAGKVQKLKPASGIIQLVFECIYANPEENEYSIVLLNYPPYDIDEQSYGGIQSFNFNSQSLNGGYITLHHVLNSRSLHVQIYDDSGFEVIPDSVQIWDADTVIIGLSSLTVSGTWRAILIGGTKPESTGEMGVYTTSFSGETNLYVNHGLGTYSVVVQVYDEDGYKIEPSSIQVTSLNGVSIIFDSEQSGKVIVSGNGIGNFTGVDFQNTDQIPEGDNNLFLTSTNLTTMLNSLLADNAISGLTSGGTGGITDVRQNGISVVTNGVANVMMPTMPTIPTELSSFIDDLGSNPTHTHSQYLTSHQDISGKEDVAKAMNTLSTSGTIVLTNNSVNKITPGGTVTFILPLEDWLPTYTINSIVFNDTAYGNGKFIIVGDSGYISSSTDGVTWSTPYQLESSYNWTCATYGNNKFSAVNTNGRISHSSDGITWSTPSWINISQTWNDLEYMNSLYLACGNNSYVATSSDGDTWNTVQVLGSSSTTQFRGIAYDGNTIVAVGSSGYIVTSTDLGTTWSTQQVGNDYWNSVTYADGKFVVVGLYGKITTSTDGTNWSTPIQVDVYSLYDIIYTDNKFIACGYDNSPSQSKVFTSTDGTNWCTPEVISNVYAHKIAYGNNSLFLVCYNGNLTIKMCDNLVDTTKFNQILVQLNLQTLQTINVGTTYYFNSTAPDLSATGVYNLVFEYDNANNYWVCGLLSKGEAV